MNNKSFSLKIPLGYEIVQRIKIVDLYTAYEILRSKKQRHITVARRTGYKAELVTHYIKCPHCSNKVYAYAHYHNKNAVAYPKKSKATIFEWSDVQPSLESEPDVELQIQEFKDFSGEYICPKCGYSSNKSNEYTELNIDYIYGKLLVKKSINNLSELVSLKWLSGTTAIEFPLYEQVVFDFESGKTYVQILNKNNIICSTAITDSEADFSGDMLIALLSKNSIVKRKIKNCLEEIIGYQIPFATNEVDIDKFVDFVRFVGFPKDFYEAIPFWGGIRVLDESFKDITDNLRTPKDAMKLLEKSSLPFCKSVKRLFAKKSGLFFYLKECEFLYGLFNDVNLFCKFLEDGTVFCYLARLHYEVAVKDFLTEYSNKVGKIKTFKVLSENRRQVFEYGINYCALSDYAKLMEQESWGADSEFFENFRSYDRYYDNLSVPMASLPSSVRDCVIGKYNFKALKTKMDYIVAGEKLKNCLGNWLSCDNPVVVVSIGKKMVAAIEINKGEVFQMRRKCNQTVSPDSELYKTTSKWCKKCNIILDPEKIDGPFIR